MFILSHRGCWNDIISDNSKSALINSLESGFGFESDLREYCGELVISHNIPVGKILLAEDIFDTIAKYNNRYCFAINIKSDGLKDLLLEQLIKFNIKNYFVFDMSIPQMIEYRNAGIIYYTRQSEYEKTPVLYEQASGVWIDAFEDIDWITEDLLNYHLNNNKKICIVSQDLHKRSNELLWERLLAYKLNFENVMLCTDYPDKAKFYFETLL